MFEILASAGLALMAQPSVSENAAAPGIDCGTFGEAITPVRDDTELCGISMDTDYLYMDGEPVAPALNLPGLGSVEQADFWVVREADNALVGIRGGNDTFDSMMMISKSAPRSFAPVYCGPNPVVTVSRFQGRNPRYLDLIGQGWEDTRFLCRLDFQEWVQTSEIEQFGN